MMVVLARRHVFPSPMSRKTFVSSAAITQSKKTEVQMTRCFLHLRIRIEVNSGFLTEVLNTHTKSVICLVKHGSTFFFLTKLNDHSIL
jgi:hypothetical protein